MFPGFISVTYFLSLASLAVLLGGNKLKRKYLGSVWTQGNSYCGTEDCLDAAVSIFRNFQKLSENGPRFSAFIGCLSIRVWQGVIQRSFWTSTIMWFFEARENRKLGLAGQIFPFESSIPVKRLSFLYWLLKKIGLKRMFWIMWFVSVCCSEINHTAISINTSILNTNLSISLQGVTISSYLKGQYINLIFSQDISLNTITYF